MLFIDVGLKAPSGAHLQDLLPAIRAAEDATHKEKGCLIYRFTIDKDDSSVLRVTELWESEEDLRAHFTGEAIKIMGQVLPHLQRLGMRAYQGDLVPYDLPLPDELTRR